ncbi:MAG TPA: hypothetical protein VK886_10685 [Vicinamibacterales bacterium]|nr:hypothetical protein [Vicinamibacterales bacterium]
MQKRTKLGLLGLAFVMAFVLAPAKSKALHAVAMDDDDVVIVGCVIAGEGDEGYVLANVLPAQSGTSQPAPSETSTGTSGSIPGTSSVLYWLDDLEDDDDLAAYKGRRVEVRGKLEGEFEKGEMEIEREGDWVEIDIESDGKKVKTRIPYVSVMPNKGAGATGTSGTIKEGKDIELDLVVRKVDVKAIRPVDGSCS